MLQKMMQKLLKSDKTTRIIYWLCVGVNMEGLIINILHKNPWLALINLLSIILLTVVYIPLLPELKRGWEKTKIIWHLVRSKQYYICMTELKTDEPLGLAAKHHCFISPTVSPIFLSISYKYAEKRAEEMEEKYNLVAQEIADVTEMKKYLKSGVYVFWVNSEKEQEWTYEVNNKILIRRNLQDKHLEMINQEELESHWEKMKDGNFVIKIFERK